MQIIAKCTIEQEYNNITRVEKYIVFDNDYVLVTVVSDWDFFNGHNESIYLITKDRLPEYVENSLIYV